MNIADIVFEQTSDFKFILKKSRVSNVGGVFSPNMVEDAFTSPIYRVIIVDSSNNVVSDNNVKRKPMEEILFNDFKYEAKDSKISELLK